MLKISPTQSAEPLSLSPNMVGNIKVDSGGGGDKTVGRSPLYIKSTIGAMGYLTPNTKLAFI